MDVNDATAAEEWQEMCIDGVLRIISGCPVSFEGMYRGVYHAFCALKHRFSAVYDEVVGVFSAYAKALALERTGLDDGLAAVRAQRICDTFMYAENRCLRFYGVHPVAPRLSAAVESVRRAEAETDARLSALLEGEAAGASVGANAAAYHELRKRCLMDVL